MFCEQCGAEIDENSAFCLKCGKPVNTYVAQNVQTQTQTNQYQAGQGQFQGQVPPVRTENKGVEPIIEQMTFDSYATAADAQRKALDKVERIKIGLYIAIGAEVFFGFWFLFSKLNMYDLEYLMFFIGILAAIASYIVGGGFMKALGMAWKVSKTIGKFGWFCTPFPADIFTGLLCTALAMCFLPIGLLFFPVIFVYLNYRQNKANLDAANQYLSYCSTANNAQQAGN